MGICQKIYDEKINRKDFLFAIDYLHGKYPLSPIDVDLKLPLVSAAEGLALAVAMQWPPCETPVNISDLYRAMLR